MPSLDQQLTACAIKYLGGGSQGRLSADGIRRKAMIQYLGGAASLGRLTTEALAARCARQYTGQTFSGMSLNGLLLRWAYAVAGGGTPGRLSLNGVAMRAANQYLTALPSPVNTVLPAITGTPQVGQTLTVSNGTWTNTPTGYTRQWKANGTDISGATGTTYVPVAGDIGKTISATVTATNAGGSTAATSAATAAVTAAALVADILLDFVNGIYRVNGTTYATAALAGFTGTGTFDANGYTAAAGTDRLSGPLSLPGDFVVFASYALPAAGGSSKTLFTNDNSLNVKMNAGGTITTFPVIGADTTSATKIAIGASGGVAKKCFDGGAVQTGSAYSHPGSTLTIGNEPFAANPWGVPIKFLAICKVTATDAQYQGWPV